MGVRQRMGRDETIDVTTDATLKYGETDPTDRCSVLPRATFLSGTSWYPRPMLGFINAVRAFDGGRLGCLPRQGRRCCYPKDECNCHWDMNRPALLTEWRAGFVAVL